MRRLVDGCFVLGFVLALGPASAARAESARSLVAEGNEAYKSTSYEEALKSYEQAIEADPQAAEARFNRGAALYRRNDLAGALDSFESAAALSRAGGDARLEAASKYNLGNVFFRQGEQVSQNDPRSAVEALRQSVGSYRDALRLDPGLTNAARNIEVARREMKKLIELAKQQPPGGPGDDKKSDNQNDLSEQIKKNLEQQQKLNQDREELENQKNSPQQQQQQAGELADRQQDLKEQSEELAEQAGQQQEENKQAQEHLEQAAQQQQKAAQELDRNQLEQAQQSQEQAQEELQKALQAAQGKSKGGEKQDAKQQQSAQNEPNDSPNSQASAEPPNMPASQALRQEPEDLLDEERANRKRRQLLLLGSSEKVEKDW